MSRHHRQPPPNPRQYGAAHFSLELDGQDSVGLFRSVEGGGVRMDVMTYQTNGTAYDRWRQLGKPKFEDIKLQVGMAMSQPFYNWIQNFFLGIPVRKTGSVIAADFSYVERARRDFTEAMIKEITFPKLDTSDTNPAYMTVGLSVEDIVFKRGSGRKLAASPGFDLQKLWSSNRFRFTISGFEAAADQVTKIESFTVKQTVVEYHMGGQLAPIKLPTAIEFPNIVFHVPEAYAHPFMDYFTNKGNLSTKNDKADKASKLHGAITTCDNGGNDTFELTFTGADIIGVSPDRGDAQVDDIKFVKIELYTEAMTFRYIPPVSFA